MQFIIRTILVWHLLLVLAFPLHASSWKMNSDSLQAPKKILDCLVPGASLSAGEKNDFLGGGIKINSHGHKSDGQYLIFKW